MKEPVILVCIKCLKRTKDWNESTRCNIHYNAPLYTYMCLECGNGYSFKALFVKPTTELTEQQKEGILKKIKKQQKQGPVIN